MHLGERECSIQRRHQKLLEESPSVAVTDKVRRKMGGVVVDAARAVQYTNAGTFEFLMDEKGNFYFMEVNTRVQVEHPVTEMVTGIDIVKEQIRIAAGERLSFKQSEVTFTGHAIECRVNAEDPETFVPSPGTIHAFSIPGGPGVRVDTAAHSECTISPYYDSMIAKVIVHGRDRQEAIARMKRTLEMSVVEGIRTTIPLHLKILNDPDFIAGRLSTHFMERFAAKPKKPSPSLKPPRRRCLPAALRDRRRRRRARARGLRRRSTWRARSSTAGVALLQLRGKTLPSGAVSRSRRRESSSDARAAGATLIVNDRADIAVLARRRRRPRRAGRSAAGGCARGRRTRRRSSGCPRTRVEQMRRGAATSRSPTSRSARCSAPAPRTPATTRSGSTLVARRGRRGARARAAGRRDRRHHARQRASRDRRRRRVGCGDQRPAEGRSRGARAAQFPAALR